jgi:acyl-CoA hydrolase
MYKPDDFNNKIIDENKLISLIEPGNRIFLSSGSAMPVRVAKAIATSENLLGYDLEIIQITAARDYFTDESSSNRNYRYKTFHSGPPELPGLMAASVWIRFR